MLRKVTVGGISGRALTTGQTRAHACNVNMPKPVKNLAQYRRRVEHEIEKQLLKRLDGLLPPDYKAQVRAAPRLRACTQAPPPPAPVLVSF